MTSRWLPTFLLLFAAPAFAEDDALKASLERLERLKRLEAGETRPAAPAASQRPDAGLPDAGVVELDPAVADALAAGRHEEALRLARVLRRDRQVKFVATRIGAALPRIARADGPAADRLCTALWECGSADDPGADACAALAVRRALGLAGKGELLKARAELADAAGRFDHFGSARRRLSAGYSQVAGVALAKSLLPDAERAATSSIELDPDSAEPYLVLGQLAFLGNDYERARSYWERGQRRTPGDRRFAEALARLTREEVTLKKFKGRRSEHFAVTFDSDVDDDTAKLAIEYLEEAWREVGRKFAVQPREPIGAILYPNQSYDSVGHPEWSNAQYDGKIRIATRDALFHTLQFKSTLFHEYAHALFARANGGRPGPGWLNEGLAQVIQNLVVPQPPMTCHWGHQAPLASLDKGFGALGRSGARAAYTTAHHAADQLLARWKWEGVHRVLAAMSTGLAFERAFERELGTPFQTWAREFDAEAPKPP